MLGVRILLCGCHDWSTKSCELQGDKLCYLHNNTNKLIINRHSLQTTALVFKLIR